MIKDIINLDKDEKIYRTLLELQNKACDVRNEGYTEEQRKGINTFLEVEFITPFKQAKGIATEEEGNDEGL